METRTILAAGCSFEGKLKCRGGARIDGDFQGEILADDILIVGKDSTIIADLNVPELNASGIVKGNVVAVKRVVLSPTAHIQGDLRTPSLTIQEGARIKGNIDVGPVRDASDDPGAAEDGV
ncbi:MAG: polymer-forming cytoskeletal protein [Parvularculaceae bacterium]